MLLAFASCKKAPQPEPPAEHASPAAPAPPPPLSPRLRGELEAFEREWPELERRENHDRSQLVRPAPRGWKPLAQGRRADLSLVLASPVIRPGEPLRLRVELRNIGSEDILLDTERSFFKDPSAQMLKFSFRLVEPDGRAVKLPSGADLGGDGLGREWKLPGWAAMSEEARQAAAEREGRRMRRQREQAFGLFLRLRPGETLCTNPRDGFRELWTEYQFKSTGTYRLQLAYDNRPPAPSEPLSEEDRRLDEQMAVLYLGLLSSEEMSFELRQ